VIVVREADPATPSFASARSVVFGADGESATVIEVTRERKEAAGPVHVTLTLAPRAEIEGETKELLR
jgi:hypothetical protein